MNKTNKILESFIKSAILAIVFVATATILSEVFTPFKDLLKNTFSHHWIGKSIIALIIFLLFGSVFSKFSKNSDQDKIISLLKLLFIFTILGFLAILGFFIFHFII